MARLRREASVVAFVCALACGATDAVRAQQPLPQDPSIPSLFSPHFDGDPQRAARFSRPGATGLPTSSAGTTGFDASNTQARRASKQRAQRRAATDAEAAAPLASSGPDRTVAPVFQRQESAAAQRRRATNSAAAPLDATGAIAPRPIRRRIVEEDPFGAVGFYRGSFLFKPSVEVSGGYNSNPGQRLNGRGSTFEKVAPEMTIRSGWSRHELSADLKGSYIWYNQNGLENLSKPDLNLRANVRIAITKKTKADIEGRYAIAADNPGDPNLPTDVATPPLFTTSGATAGLTQGFNRLELSGKVSTDRTVYKDATLNDGSLLDLSDRNYQQTGLRLRASYETMPGVRPFIEYGIDRRRHETLDPQGQSRDSDAQSIRGGTSFELTGYLIGEVSAGWLERDYVSPAFDKVHGTLLDASLTYYATPLTTIKVTANTTVDESILSGVSGALRRDFGLQIDHAFRRWLVGNVTLGYGTDTYEGSTRKDDRYIVATSLIYKMTREMHLKGEYRREWLRSTFDGQDYTANIFTVGLRLQR